MALHQSNAAKGVTPIPYPSISGPVTGFRVAFTVPDDIVEGDIIEMCAIPPGCRVVDAIFDSDDLDSGTPAIVWDIGIMSGAFGDNDADRTCGDEFFDGITTSQGGGAVRSTLAKAFRTTTAATARGVGAKLVTDAATAVEGVIGLTLFYVAE